MSARRKAKTGFADILAHLPTPTRPTPAPLRRTVRGATLHDRAGELWQVEAAWLEPDEVAALLTRGTPWVVEWCGGDLRWSDEEDADVLARSIRPRLITSAEATRLSRRRSVPTVVAAALLANARAKLIFFSEGAPGERF
ncbi:hypothetical protein [Alloactinosynnema sp. L-07]|uniref:hypothetical protein n=1 Tax=Alloactinosynnema sp. L-07 TaxID=1653480 RepID=UPI00065F063C|nr:hypothetical protein [Alloactinosynnema sp. L-07]CRK60926.1 hypothetical protein [Alloactinosynnema sp. L-07]